MVQKMWEYVCKNQMICSGDTVLMGCSGGADSVALLLALKELQEKCDFSLQAIHVEHGIRGEESKEDQRFVEALCKKWDIPLRVVCVEAKKYADDCHVGLEEAARVLRYEAFSKEAERLGGNVKLALAHHMEDNAETILFQLARGSGIAGLCGMPMVRREEHYTLIRPLLSNTREEIEDYLADRNQAFCVDSTNSDEGYSRNRIRRQILPQLALVNGKAVLHMNQSAMQLCQINDFLEKETERAYRLCFEKKECGYLDIPALSKLHPAIRTGVVRRCIFEMTGKRKDISLVHVQEVLSLLEKQTGSRVNLPYRLQVTVTYDKLCFETINEKSDQREAYAIDEALLLELKESGRTFVFSLGEQKETLSIRVEACNIAPEEIEKKAYTKILDYDKIREGFVIRNRRSGDYFIMNEKGNRKKLASFFIDEKIPARERKRMYLLAKGSEVIWLIGGRISENYKVTANTKYILIIEYHGGTKDGL